jgi:nucleotide-binding universal stress UspA family protein
MAVTAGATIGVRVEAIHVRGATQPPTELALALGLPLELAVGEPVAAIVHAFAGLDVALGVIGARRDAKDYRFAGSVAAAIIARTPVPVIVVGPSASDPAPSRFSRVLVPLDGTPAAARAMEDVVALFAACNVDVVVHHVFDRETVPAFWDQAQHAHESWSREFLARWSSRPGAAITLRRGNAADAILAAAAADHADLIALAWAQDSSPGHADVVKNALLHLPVPVLLIPLNPRQLPPESNTTRHPTRQR